MTQCWASIVSGFTMPTMLAYRLVDRLHRRPQRPPCCRKFVGIWPIPNRIMAGSEYKVPISRYVIDITVSNGTRLQCKVTFVARFDR